MDPLEDEDSAYWRSRRREERNDMIVLFVLMSPLVLIAVALAIAIATGQIENGISCE